MDIVEARNSVGVRCINSFQSQVEAPQNIGISQEPVHEVH